MKRIFSFLLAAALFVTACDKKKWRNRYSTRAGKLRLHHRADCFDTGVAGCEDYTEGQ